MKRLITLAALGLTLVFASNSLAAGYGAAGCGFGATLIKENTRVAQIGAWLLNAIGIQTFALTSGTSECGGTGVITAKTEQENFVGANYDTLEKEMAIGKGENLSTLASLLGCPAEQAGSFGSFTREHYKTLFQSSETTPAAMLVALKNGLSSSPVFATSCQKI